MTDEAKRSVEALRMCDLPKNVQPVAFYVCRDCCAYEADVACQINLTAAEMIESLSDKNKQLEYTLVGVMHFVDKWLDDIEPYSLVDDPSGQIAIDRAAEARRIALEHIEDLTREMYRRGQELSEVQKQRDAAVRDMKDLCDVCAHFKTCEGPWCGDCDSFDRCESPCKTCAAEDNWQWRGVKEGSDD